MRTSLYKSKIIALLEKRHLLTINEIHQAIPEANFSTIFRNVEQLSAAGDIKAVQIDNKQVAYESAKHHHDHFICTDCGDVEEIHFPLPKALAKKNVSDVTVRGTCGSCSHE